LKEQQSRDSNWLIVGYYRELLIVMPLMMKQGVTPKPIITGKLRSNTGATPVAIPTVEHQLHNGLNNRPGNPQLPSRKRNG
jgi:putative transposase